MFEINKKYKIFLKNSYYYEVIIIDVDTMFIKGIDRKGTTIIINLNEINDCSIIE